MINKRSIHAIIGLVIMCVSCDHKKVIKNTKNDTSSITYKVSNISIEELRDLHKIAETLYEERYDGSSVSITVNRKNMPEELASLGFSRSVIVKGGVLFQEGRQNNIESVSLAFWMPIVPSAWAGITRKLPGEAERKIIVTIQEAISSPSPEEVKKIIENSIKKASGKRKK